MKRIIIHFRQRRRAFSTRSKEFRTAALFPEKSSVVKGRVLTTGDVDSGVDKECCRTRILLLLLCASNAGRRPVFPVFHSAITIIAGETCQGHEWPPITCPLVSFRLTGDKKRTRKEAALISIKGSKSLGCTHTQMQKKRRALQMMLMAMPCMQLQHARTR